MNMRFQQPDGIALRHFRKDVDIIPPAEVYEKPRPTLLKYSLLSAVALAGIYLLITLSAKTLLVIGATCVGLAALATAVCIYAMNNMR